MEVEHCNSATPPPLKRCRRRLDVNEVLPDEILVQILSCLPCQSAVTCKLVCKRWLSLISTPIFISCCISRQIQQHHDYDERYPIWKLIAHDRYVFLTSQLLKPDVSFSFLPYDRSSYLKPDIKIRALSDDLFLCHSRLATVIPYFICNPFTKEWFELPQPPSSTTSNLVPDHYVFGFTHKPYYRVQEDHRVLLNSTCRFRVVRLKVIIDRQLRYPFRKASEFEVDIFSSETWKWTTSVMQHSSRPTTPSSCISRNGFLYWFCRSGQVIIHDPYNNKVCYVVELRPPQDVRPSWYRFGVCQGSLLAFDIYSGALRVWELEDDDCDGHLPKWRFVTRSDDFIFSKMEALTVHPNDRNIIYFYTGSREIGTLSLRTKEFKHRFVQKLPTKVTWRTYELGSKEEAAEIVTVKAPCWPTPVSALFNQRG